MDGKHGCMEVMLGCNRIVTFIGSKYTIYVMVSSMEGESVYALGTPTRVVRELFSVLGSGSLGSAGEPG